MTDKHFGEESISSFEKQVRDVQCQVVSEMLDTPPVDLNTFKAIFEHSLELAETLIANNMETAPPPTPIHCGKGCAWCCHSRHIMVTPLEVLVLADYMRDTFSGEQQAAFLQKIIKGDSTRGGPMQACPLLEDGSCTVYPSRPFMCRAHNSFDVEACQAAVEADENTKVPTYYPQKSIFNQIQAGLALGFTEHGHSVVKLTLRRAIRIALENEDTFERWTGGEPIFMDASIG